MFSLAIVLGLISTLAASLIFLFFNHWRQGSQKYEDSNEDGSKKYHYQHMSMMSELFHKMYLKNMSPIIHGFEFYAHEHNNNNNIDIKQDENGHLEQIKHFWKSLCERYFTFRAIPYYNRKYSRWYWKELHDNDWDINDQIQHIKLDSESVQPHYKSYDNNNNSNEGNNSINDKLLDIANKYINEKTDVNKKFDENKPHWHVYYFTFTHHINKSLMVAKFHHSIGDGILLTKVLQYQHSYLYPSLHNEDKNGKNDKNDEIHASKSIQGRSPFKKMVDVITIIPWTIFDLFRFFLQDNSKATSIFYYNNKNATMSQKYKTKYSITLAVDELNKITKSLHKEGTINDIISTLFCSGLARYISKKKPNNDPLYLRFVSIFNLHSMAAKDLDKLLKSFEHDSVDNSLIMIPIPLPCHSDITFEQRFLEVHNMFYKFKFGLSAMIGVFLFKFLYYINGNNSDLVMALMLNVSKKCSIMLSNLIGPQVPLFIGDNHNTIMKIKYIFNTTNPTSIPISIGVESYLNNLKLTVTTDDGFFKDGPDELLQYVQEEYLKQRAKIL